MYSYMQGHRPRHGPAILPPPPAHLSGGRALVDNDDVGAASLISIKHRTSCRATGRGTALPHATRTAGQLVESG